MDGIKRGQAGKFAADMKRNDSGSKGRQYQPKIPAHIVWHFRKYPLLLGEEALAFNLYCFETDADDNAGCSITCPVNGLFAQIRVTMKAGIVEFPMAGQMY